MSIKKVYRITDSISGDFSYAFSRKEISKVTGSNYSYVCQKLKEDKKIHRIRIWNIQLVSVELKEVSNDRENV